MDLSLKPGQGYVPGRARPIYTDHGQGNMARPNTSAILQHVPTILKFRDSGFAESRGYQNATIIFFAKNQWPLNAIHGFQAWVILSLESVVAERVGRTPAHKFMGIVA